MFWGYGKAWLRNSAGLVGPLERLTISLTDRCNSRCMTCFIWRNQGIQFDFDAVLLDNLTCSRLYRSVKEVMLTGGELSLRDDLVEIVARLRTNRTMYLTLSTNGLLPEKIEAQVREMQKRRLRPDRATLSLDGRPDTYTRIRGVKHGFEKTVDTARRLRVLGLDVSLIFTITRGNIADMLWCAEFSRAEGFDISYFPEIHSSRFEKSTPSRPLDEAQKAEVLDQLRTIYRTRHRYYFDDSVYLHTERYFQGRKVTDCEAGRQNIYVNWDGRVYPCEALPGSEQYFGSLREATLDDIFLSSKARQVRAFIRRDACQPCYMACDIVPSLRKQVPSLLWQTMSRRARWMLEGR
jgi:radical SAM protein with 4Fe4S-binding SPASM domain